MAEEDINDLHFIVGELYVAHRKALDKIDKLERENAQMNRLNEELEAEITRLRGFLEGR